MIKLFFSVLFFLIISTLNCFADSIPALRPSPEELSCKAASDCELVPVACACDYGLFVNKNSTRKLEMKLNELCADYRGMVCKMAAVFIWPSCEKNRCITNFAKERNCDSVKDKKYRAECRKKFPAR